MLENPIIDIDYDENNIFYARLVDNNIDGCIIPNINKHGIYTISKINKNFIEIDYATTLDKNNECLITTKKVNINIDDLDELIEQLLRVKEIIAQLEK